MSFRDVRFFAVVFTALAWLAATQAVGQPRVRLEADMTVLTSENPFLLRGDRTGSSAAEIAIRPTVTWTLPPGTTLEAEGVVVDRQYFSGYGNVLTGRLEGRANYRRDERLSWSASARVARDQNVDLLGSAVDAAVDPQSVRESYGARAGAIWNPDGRTTLSPTVGWEQASFSGSAALADVKSLDISLPFSKRVDPYTSLGLRGSLLFSRVAALDFDVQSLIATAERRLSPGWRGRIELGVERTGSRTEALLGVPVAQDSQVRLNGAVELCRDTPRTSACLTGALRSLAAGIGGLQRELSLRATGRHRLSASDEVEVSADYRRSTLQGGVVASLDVFRARGLYGRRLGRELWLAGFAEYARRRTIEGDRVGAATLGLQLRFRKDAR